MEEVVQVARESTSGAQPNPVEAEDCGEEKLMEEEVGPGQREGEVEMGGEELETARQ